jgi:GTP-binding protein Era
LKIYTKSDLKSRITIPNDGNSIQISSVDKKGFDTLLEKIKSFLEEGPLLFPEDYYTKQDIYFRISEIIREKTFLNTKEELPHSTYI